MERCLTQLFWWAVTLLPLMQLLQLLHVADSSVFRCKMDHSLFRSSRQGFPFPANPEGESEVTLGVFGTAPAIVTLLNDKLTYSMGYQVTLSDRFRMQIDRVKSGVTERLIWRSVPRGLLSSEEIRYFWIRAEPLPGGDAQGPNAGTISFGRLGDTKPLLSFTDRLVFASPSTMAFRGNPYWLHSCSTPPPQPTLGCRKMFATRRADFWSPFPIADEQVELDNATKAVRFMVRAVRDAYVRLGVEPTLAPTLEPRTPVKFFEINLNGFMNKITLQKGSNIQSSTATCQGCLSSAEFRLFTIVYNNTHLMLFEGSNMTHPRVQTSMDGLAINSISFASAVTAPQTFWLHACQGEVRAQRSPLPETAPVSPTSVPFPLGPYHLRAFAANNSEALEAAEAATAGCRMLHTFKYKFDTFFSVHDDGWLNGTTTVLPFRVLGRRDFHIQLVSRMPPLGNETYEIDIDFNNRTNIDRGLRTRLASFHYARYFSPHELRGFVLMHDRVTGNLEITTAEGESIITWRDPDPFPVRYFSVASGSSAGNDTTWVFGCPSDPPTKQERDRMDSGCSLPLLTHSYSHAQYFSVSREGVINGTLRTINFFVRASGSGHVRLEYVLPPHLTAEALYEVDLSHEGVSSIDSLGARMVGKPTPGLLSVNELRGFWIRQDMATRRLEVGAFGEEAPLLSWTAKPEQKFLEMRYFSFTTSRSVSNGTWVYGCKANRQPVEKVVSDTGEGDVDESALEGDPVFENWSPLNGPTTDSSALSTSPTASSPASSPTHLSSTGSEPPPPRTIFGVQLNLSRIYFDDLSGMAVVRGHLRMAWRSRNWGPSTLFDSFESGDDVEASGVWIPRFTVFHGDAEVSGQMRQIHGQIQLWEAALYAEARCRLLARGWPRDQHHCEIALTLGDDDDGVDQDDQGYSLFLIYDQPEEEAAAATEPLWKLVSLDVRVRPESYNTLRITIELRRATPVLQHILLAPFIVLSALCMLAYWIPEPLPRDKVWLGCAALILIVITFLVLEAACPPGLIGLPAIVELYCICVCIVALSVIVTAIMSAIAREAPLRSPPSIICRVLSNSILRWLLLLSDEQIDLKRHKAALNSDAVGYTKGSSQVYVKFESSTETLCKCTDRNCSKQIAFQAQHFWTLLALACERIFSLMCLLMLSLAAALVAAM